MFQYYLIVYVFNFSQNKVALRVRMQAEQQIIRGEISDLKVYICEFNPARRNSTKHFVLQPCTLTLHANTPEKRGMNICLNVSDVRINISPGMSFKVRKLLKLKFKCSINFSYN